MRGYLPKPRLPPRNELPRDDDRPGKPPLRELATFLGLVVTTLLVVDVFPLTEV